MKPTNSSLSVKVVGDQLVISIGVSTLAYALQTGPQPLGATIKNPNGFARDIATDLERDEDFDGHNSRISALLEKCAANAIEWGSEHVHLDGDPKPFVT